jgi:hypothetical protein
MPFVYEVDELEARPRVLVEVAVRFHQDDYDRVRELALAAPDDHMLTLTDQDEAIILGTWRFEAPAGRYDAVKRLLAAGGLQVIRHLCCIKPGAVFVAANGRVRPIE